jgi:hypothetical protein
MRFIIDRIVAYACAAVAFSVAAAAGAASLLPGVASATVGPDTSFPCHSSSPCVIGVNGGSGPGIKGLGKTGAGVVGTSTKGFAVEGDSGNGGAGGVKGIGTTGPGLYGQSSKNWGVEAISSTNIPAIYGLNTGTGIAIEGVATNGTAINAFTASGTALNVTSNNGASADFSGTTAGILIHTPNGTGTYPIYATDTTGFNLFAVNGNGNTIVTALSDTGIDVSATTGTAAYLHSVSADGALITGGATNNGAIIVGANGVVARAPAGTGNFPIIAQDTTANNVFYVNGNGDVFYHGSLNHFARTRGGQRAMAFGSNATTPSLEDVGSAQLVNGHALVQLDPTFAQSIDLHTPYHVFLTPDGDTRGLYVASKGPDVFVVRETQNGRSTLAFDYRIVATALGHAGERMALVSLSREPRVPIVRPRAVPTPHARIVGARTKNVR